MNAELRSVSQRARARACDHFVHFYDQQELLASEVGRFIRNGLETGAGAVLIARPETMGLIRAEWRRQQFDDSPSVVRGQLRVLDAEETVQCFMRDGMPDQKLFDEVIGGLVQSMLGAFDELVAFGEMVSILWRQERHQAAIALERMWDELVNKHRFALYCAYSTEECAQGHLADAFREVCNAHSYVIPAEGMRTPRTEDQQVRWIAELQQQAGSLKNELAARRDAEARLAARERELSDFVNNAAMALHRVGPDGTILWANAAELSMLGYAESEYVGRNITEFYVDPVQIARILDTLCGGQTLHDEPVKLRCKDGSLRHVLVTSNALFEQGKLVSTRCFTRDVTDRWLAQEALRERSAILHLAMQGARMGYWVGEADDGTIRCSHELLALLGADDVTDRPFQSFLDLMHADDRPAFEAAYRDAVVGRGVLQTEFRARKGAEWRWYEARGEAIYDAEGHAMRFYGVCADVSARRREQHLLQHLAAVVDSADDAIVSKTLDGIVTSWNAAATRIFGYTAAEMVGRSIELIVPGELRSEEAGILQKMRAGERIEHFVTTRLARDGTRKRMSITVSPVRDAVGRIVGASKIAREVAST